MKPTYPLTEVKQLIHKGQYRVTRVAFDYAAADFSFNEVDIVQAVLNLRASDFYKTMPSEQLAGLWQDVYKPFFLIAGQQVQAYVKLQITGQRDGDLAIIISFKRA